MADVTAEVLLLEVDGVQVYRVVEPGPPSAPGNKGDIWISPDGVWHFTRTNGSPADGINDDAPYWNDLLAAGKSVVLDDQRQYLLKSRVQITVDDTGIEGNGALVKMSTAAGDFDNTSFSAVNRYGGKAVAIDCTGSGDGARRAGCFVRGVRLTPTLRVEGQYLKPINHKFTTEFEVSDCELWNFARMRGHITGNNVNGSRLLNNYVHDSYTNSTLGTETEAQVTGFEFDGDSVRLVDIWGEPFASRDCLISGNRIINMTLSAAALAALKHQSDGINLQGFTAKDATSKPTRGFTISNNLIRNCGEGIDCFGSFNLIEANTIEWAVFAVKTPYGASHNIIQGNSLRFIAEGGWYAGGAPSGVFADLDGNILAAMKPKADWWNADGTKMYDYVASGSVPYKNSAASAGVKFAMVDNAVVNTVKNSLIDNNVFDMASPDLGFGANTDAVVVLHENGTGGSPTNKVGTNNRIISYSPGVYNDPGKYLIIERGYPVTKTASFTLADDENNIIVDRPGNSTTITFPLASRHPGRRVRIVTRQNQVVQASSAIIMPITGGASGTAILPAVAGKWAEVESDGSIWAIAAAN